MRLMAHLKQFQLAIFSLNVHMAFGFPNHWLPSHHRLNMLNWLTRFVMIISKRFHREISCVSLFLLCDAMNIRNISNCFLFPTKRQTCSACRMVSPVRRIYKLGVPRITEIPLKYRNPPRITEIPLKITEIPLNYWNKDDIWLNYVALKHF